MYDLGLLNYATKSKCAGTLGQRVMRVEKANNYLDIVSSFVYEEMKVRRP